MSVIKLSHTSKEMYLRSPRAYYYHYNLYLREKVMGSPLFFGSLIETGLNALFEGATLEQALDTFKRNFKKYTINGELVDLSLSPLVRYNKADLDLDVFTDKEQKDLEGKSIQFQSWASLQRKGEMLIRSYYQDIFPKIKKVIAVQKYFSIKNESDDEINGFADLICEWEDGRLIIPDHKTSGLAYPENAVLTEQYGKQTALYYEAFKSEYPIDSVGFFVLEKKIRKKEPRARVTAIIDKPPEELIQKTFDEFDFVLYNIKQGNFPCTAPKCEVYGQECCYKRYCKSGGTDLTGLVKVGKK